MAEIIPRDFIELLLAKVDLVDLINLQIPLRKKSGSNYFARCPFHNEKSASFSVSQPKQFYYCFGCGAHGNAIDFLMQHDRLSFPEAIETLARQAGMEIPRTQQQVAKKDDSIPELYNLCSKIATDYYEQMRKSNKAIQYLKNRGISGVIAQQFNLGYAPNAWSHLLDAYGITDLEKKKLLDTGLIIKKNEGGYYDRFRDRIMFPIRDTRGRVIGFGGRVIDQGEPKYLNSPETVLFQKGHELYGLHEALKENRQLKCVLVVEGYMDVIALFQHGITYAVATLGTATTAHHLQRLFRYTNEIVFCFDGDQAGRTAAWRAAQVLLPLMHDSLQVRFLFLPDGEDPDSLIRKIGREAFETLILNAHTLSTFFFQTLSQQCDMQSMEGRARFASLALEQIKQIPDGIFHNLLLDELSKRARVPLTQLKSTNKSTATPVITKPEQTKINFPTPIRLAIALLLQQPDLASALPTSLPTSNLPGHAFLQQLIEIIQQKPDITTGRLLEYWRGQEEETWIGQLAQWEHTIPANGLKNELLGAIRQLTLLSYEAEINRLLSKAAHQGLSDGEKQQLTEWIARKKDIIPVIS